VSNVSPMSAGLPQGPSSVVLSPHLDDAVLSVWHVLDSPADVRVVTVFAGVPEPGFVTALDRARGGTESAQVVRRRRDDDRAALALAGRDPTHAAVLDADYRAFRIPGLRAAIERDPTQFVRLVAGERELQVGADELLEALGGWLDRDIVYAPAGIGGHPDHRDVGRLGLRLAEDGHAVRLYADIPYLVRHGLPSWLSGVENPRADELVEAAFRALPAGEDFDRHVVELSPEQIAEKLAAFERYETEFDLVNADFDGAVTDPELMRREVYWTRRTADGDGDR
jgi:LmbE family N-acetylglucosaminyl deacetylase